MLLPALLNVCAALWLAPPSSTWQGTWSASVGNGAVSGTWEARASDEPDTVAGNWTLTNPRGDTLAAGTWNARKNGKIWNGVWQARNAAGRIYKGTWHSRSALSPAEAFPALLDSALHSVMEGTWRMGT